MPLGCNEGDRAFCDAINFCGQGKRGKKWQHVKYYLSSHSFYYYNPTVGLNNNSQQRPIHREGKGMHRISISTLITLCLFLLFPDHSLAHLDNTEINTFYEGMLFPFSSPEHLLLLFALSVLIIQVGKKIYQLALFLFPLSLIAGMLLGYSLEIANSRDPLTFTMVFLLGLCLALPRKVNIILLSMLTTLTGIILGYGSGVDNAGNGAGSQFLSGLVLTETMLLTLVTTWVPQHFFTDSKPVRGITSGLILAGGFILLTLFLTTDTSLSLQGIALPSEESLTNMIKREDMGLAFVCTTLFLSLIWGAGHALTPGHGKAIVAAYLIGARSTPWHAVYLGLTVTVTHTLGIFCLGLIALFASQFILPETLYPWLAAISGIIVLILGLTMLVNRFRAVLRKATHRHHHHDHPHDHHHHSHEGVHSHSHLPTEHDTSVSWKTLLGLGISGGLLPCPSALVLLLAAISIQRIGFGMALVFTFSIGLAAVLTTVGLLFIKGSKIIQKIPQASAATRVLPIMSAFLIFILGGYITWEAVKIL